MRETNNTDEAPVTGFILAGGQSTRMGTDKAFLQLGGETLLARSLKEMNAVVAEVRIVGSVAKFGDYGPVVEDIYPNRGPLGGIHAALKSSATDLNLVLAVDLPFVEERFLHYLIRRARAAAAAITVPRASGGWQPLCAVYRRTFAAAADQSLLKGRNRIDAVFAEVEIETIEESELTQIGFSPGMFGNLNTPADWEQARNRL
jgi:molybdopterin-guanine dinucleotide biosynthesis protein A